MNIRSVYKILLPALAAVLVAACGGGGGGGSSSGATTTPPVVSSCTGALPNLYYSTSYITSVGATATFTPTSLSTMPSGCNPTVSATGLPAGLSINAATGVISGTPSATGTSTVVVSYVVRDNAGASVAASPATSTVTVVVNPASVALTAAQTSALKSAHTSARALVRANQELVYAFGYIASNSTNLTGTNAQFPASISTVCSNGGSYSATWVYGSTSSFTVGDNLSIAYSNCGKSDGYVYSGTASYAISARSSTQNLTTMTANISGLTISKSGVASFGFGSGNLNLSHQVGNLLAYPISYITSGNIALNLSNPTGNHVAGSYSVTNASLRYYLQASSLFNQNLSFSSTDGTYPTSVTTPSPDTQSGTGVYSVSYAGATIAVSAANATSSAVTGTHSNGSPIAATTLTPGLFY